MFSNMFSKPYTALVESTKPKIFPCSYFFKETTCDITIFATKAQKDAFPNEQKTKFIKYSPTVALHILCTAYATVSYKEQTNVLLTNVLTTMMLGCEVVQLHC